MANRYWVGNGGKWNDTAHWSTSSGGASGASVPTTNEDVFFDANSFTIGGQVVTADQNIPLSPVCNSMDWTGVTNVPTLADGTDLNNTVRISGNATNIASLTFSSGMSVALTGSVAVGGDTITTSSVDFGGLVSIGCILSVDANITGGVINILSDMTAPEFQLDIADFFGTPQGTLNLNSHTLSNNGTGALNLFRANTINAGTTATLNLNTGNGLYSDIAADTITNNIDVTLTTTGSAIFSIIALTTGSIRNVTINAGGSWRIAAVNGTTVNPVISGTMTVNAGASVKVEAGTTYGVNNLLLNGVAGNMVTLRSSLSGTQATLSVATITATYVDVKDSIASGVASPFTDIFGIDSGNNTNWIFTFAAQFLGVI